MAVIWYDCNDPVLWENWAGQGAEYWSQLCMSNGNRCTAWSVASFYDVWASILNVFPGLDCKVVFMLQIIAAMWCEAKIDVTTKACIQGFSTILQHLVMYTTSYTAEKIQVVYPAH